jgi:NAD(P) transhydrogenase subunit beta
MEFNILTLCYLLGSVTFILGLKMLSNPATARRGNLIAAFGMSIAILGTIFLYRDDQGNRLHNYAWIFGGILIGGTVGTLAARKVKMTAMPEMVSMFNGMGGACAALISVVEFNRLINDLSFTINPRLSDLTLVSLETYLSKGELLIILIGLVIGSISFAGSMIAWAKLNGTIKDYSFKGQHLLNLLFLFMILAGIVYLMIGISQGFVLVSGAHITALQWVRGIFYGIFALALLYGVLFVMPIGGADMPVVISILNSFTGVAAACGGFLYNNKVMLTGGILVGAAGTLLTILMCKAMNRSLGMC